MKTIFKALAGFFQAGVKNYGVNYKSNPEWNDQSDPLWKLAVTEYKGNELYAYNQLVRGKRPNERQI